MKQTALQKAIKEAAKPLPFKRNKDINALLEFAADDMAEAYRIGAEEAQRTILARLEALRAKEQAG